VTIVDDTEDNRDLLYYLLRSEFEVSRHSNGEDALLHLAHSAPDAIVLDIRLPGMNGIEMLNRIREDTRLRSIPVVALTANAMAGDREKYLAAGFDEYIAKPIVDLDAFVNTIRRLANGSE
jgi:CheY-like chemotaxis protein